jgi:peptidylprolyl isomerase
MKITSSLWRNWRLVLGGLLVLTTAQAGEPDAANTLILKTKDGEVVLQLRPDLAPKHVERMKALVQKKFYDGLKFHRVIDGFMVQTGDPKGNGTGGSDLPDLAAEFSDKATFERGTLGMARASDPNSANSQFFICLAPAPFLNGQYTIFGQVTKGMEIVDKIKKGAQADNGAVVDPDLMLSLRLLGSKK